MYYEKKEILCCFMMTFFILGFSFWSLNRMCSEHGCDADEKDLKQTEVAMFFIAACFGLMSCMLMMGYDMTKMLPRM